MRSNGIVHDDLRTDPYLYRSMCLDGEAKTSFQVVRQLSSAFLAFEKLQLIDIVNVNLRKIKSSNLRRGLDEMHQHYLSHDQPKSNPFQPSSDREWLARSDNNRIKGNANRDLNASDA